MFEDIGCGLKFCMETCTGPSIGNWSTDEEDNNKYFTCVPCSRALEVLVLENAEPPEDRSNSEEQVDEDPYQEVDRELEDHLRLEEFLA